MIKAAGQATQIIIVGSGFGGIGLGIRLKQAGINDFIILEKAHSLGGTWRDNHYPGAACDVPSHLYSFSFVPKGDWPQKYATQKQILQYLQDCAHKYGVLEHIHFNTEVRSAAFDARASHWAIQTAAGAEYRARIFISACGQLNRPAYAKLPGIESFAGKQFHSAQWDHNYDLKDKQVAVIGTGASAIQFVPEIAQQASQLFVFQRSAPYVIPKPDAAYSPRRKALYNRLPSLYTLSRFSQYLHHESRLLAFVWMKPLMSLVKLGWWRNVKRTVSDHALRRKLIPNYPMGCKRILISNDYYPALVQKHVQLITDPIREISGDAVLTQSGQRYRVDVLIHASGFHSTDFLAPMRILGLQGRDLNQVWRSGAEAYLGICVSGFPNFFMLYGPNTNLGHNSIIYMLESQFRYIIQAINLLRGSNLGYMDVRQDIQSKFNQHIHERIKRTVWDQGCNSWYKTEAGKNTNNWPSFTFNYRHQTAQLKLADYILNNI